MKVLRNACSLVTCRDDGGQGDVHPIERGAMVFDDSIVWIGAESELPIEYRELDAVDGKGGLVVPGLVDCHTHLAFGGSRADEFEQRVLGAGYLEIARAGGGIQRTVRDTRASTTQELLAGAERTLDAMAHLGVTTVECKSGYGLSLDQELKLLRVYRTLAESQPLRIVPTFLGAHVVGPEWEGNREGYVDLVCREMIPAVAEEGLAEFCDVFVEEGAFSSDQARAVLESAAGHGLRGKLHVDQLSDVGGGELAAETGAVSADHLEYTSEAGIAAMAKSGTVAVSLPFASLFLKQPPMPARKFIDQGVAVAVATDYNPGSAPSFHLPLAMLLASVTHGLAAGEVLKGATIHAARAIGLHRVTGSLEHGKAADFLVVDAPDLRDWLYRFRANAVAQTWVGGERVGAST